jgi:hypothetical protein
MRFSQVCVNEYMLPPEHRLPCRARGEIRAPNWAAARRPRILRYDPHRRGEAVAGRVRVQLRCAAARGSKDGRAEAVKQAHAQEQFQNYPNAVYIINTPRFGTFDIVSALRQHGQHTVFCV